MSDATRSGERDWRHALLLVAATTVVRLVVAARVPLVPDEAYYWTWSRWLEPGYLDHPPGIALAIRLGTLFLGATTLGVRIVPVLLGALMTVAIAALARRLAGGPAALAAAAIGAVVPLASAGLLLATPDAPLLAAWACALYAVVRALSPDATPSAAWGWWAAAGVATGAAALSKYTAVLLPVGVVLALASRADLRPALRRPGPYAAVAIATVVFAPVLLWNARHHWVSFAFQLQHGLAPRPGHVLATALRFESELLGGQLGLVSPVLFVLVVVAVWRALRSGEPPLHRLIAVSSTFAMALFVGSALRGRVEANWPAPAYVGALALVAAGVSQAVWRRWLVAGTGLAVALTLLVYVLVLGGVRLPGSVRDPLDQAYGWESLGSAARAALDAPAAPGARSWLAAPRYQDAAMLAWHTPGQPRVFSLNLTGRANAHDFWPAFPERARQGDRLVLALPATDTAPELATQLRPCFAVVRPGEWVLLRRGARAVDQRRLYVLEGWRGTWPVVDRSAGQRAAPRLVSGCPGDG